MKAHASCVLEILARGLAVLVMENGFARAWITLLAFVAEDPGWLRDEHAHELANRLVLCGHEKGGEWVEPCAALAKCVRACFGSGEDATFGPELFEPFASRWPGRIQS